MLELFIITFNQTFTLFLFILLGFLLKKSGKVKGDISKGLSVITVNIFTPLLSMKTFANNFTKDVISEKATLMGISLISLLVFLGIGYCFSLVFAREKGKPSRDTFDIYLYTMTISNLGYFGYPVIESIFGEQMLFNFMIFTIPHSIFINSVGVYLLNPNKELSFKSVLNMPMIGILVGMVLGFFEIKLPTPFLNVMSTGGACMAPVAMILTGIIFASNDLKSMVASVKIYVLYFLKLLILPLLLVPVLMWLKLPEEASISILTIAVLPAGLNSIVFPEAFGGDSKTGAKLCFVSLVMCVITIPIVYTIFQTYVI